MSTISLRNLQERLNREAPGLQWECDRGTRSQSTGGGAEAMTRIEVRASKQGVPVKGSPFYLSSECLARWGADASAALICNELAAGAGTSIHRSRVDWDRLAEI